MRKKVENGLFPPKEQTPMRIYLDNAATTPMREEVIEAMAEAMRTHHGNPSSIHADGRSVRAAIESARKQVASFFNASIGEIFFTSGGTEGNNMAIKCAVRDLGVRRIISSPIEHHCVGHSLDTVKKMGVKVDLLTVNGRGQIDYGQLENMLHSGNGTPTLVSIMHANNEIGTVQDMQLISEICEKYNAYFHSDTVQTIGHLPIDVTKTKIHFFAGGAHKFHGPKGCGFLYINSEVALKPFIDGGSQERNMRAGTENVYGIVGMAKALELACENMSAYRAHIEEVRDHLKRRLAEEFEDIHFHGDHDGQYLYTVLNVCFPASPKSAMLLLLLDMAGVSASGGSACSSGAEKGSHVLAAIGADPKRKSIRFSFSHENTKVDIDFLVEKLKGMVEVKMVEMV